jgi:hypothetical protein
MFIPIRQNLDLLLHNFNLPKVVLELGVAEGWFTKDILKWDLDKLYLIDNWATIGTQTGDGAYNQEWHDGNYKQVLERTAPFSEKVTIIKGLSWEVADQVPDNSLGLLYIDACHEYECVKKDLAAYFSKVVPGGIIAGHDYLNLSYGVNEAVKEFCEGKYEINVVPDEHESMASFWFIKPL